jgi:hypothetical protein
MVVAMATAQNTRTIRLDTANLLQQKQPTPIFNGPSDLKLYGISYSDKKGGRLCFLSVIQMARQLRSHLKA